jgi:tetratricopeptide (TPR) repeat protein
MCSSCSSISDAIESAKKRKEAKDEQRAKPAKALYDEGREKYKSEEWDAAIASFTQCMEYSKKHRIKAYIGDAYYARGQAYLRKGDTASAISDFTSAVDYYKEHPYEEDGHLFGIYVSRGFIYLDNGEREKAGGDFSNAESYARHEALKRDALTYLEYANVSSDAYQAYKRGNTALNRNDFDSAITEYTEAIRLAPKFISAYNNRGVAYERSNRYTEVEADYKRVIELDPKHDKAYTKLVDLYKKWGMFDHADNIVDKMIPFFSRVYVQGEREKIAKARKEYIARERERKYEQANVYLNQKDYTKAIALYREILEEDSSYKDTRKNLKLAWDRRSAENPNSYPAPFNGTWKHITTVVENVPAKTVPNYITEPYDYSVPYYTEEYYQNTSPSRYDPVTGRTIPGVTTRGTRRVQRSRRVSGIRTVQRGEKTIPAYTIPEESVVWEFNGSTYRMTELKTDQAILAGLSQGIMPRPSEKITTSKTKTGSFYYNGDRIELEDGTVLRFINGVIADGAGNRYTKQ